MTTGPVQPSPDPDDPEEAIRDARQRFIASFSGRCDAIKELVDDVATGGGVDKVRALRDLAHRIVGLAGTVGFPGISENAAGIESLCDDALRGTPLDWAFADALLGWMRESFAKEVTRAPSWAPVVASDEGDGVKILMAEDDEDQRRLVMRTLLSAGYQPIGLPSGDLVLEKARAERPAAILLDVNMPGMDGYRTCRLLKATSDVAGIPVIFMTARGTVDERLAGLTLGADDYLVKPVDMGELLLRLRLVRRRVKRAEEQGPPGEARLAPAGPLSYDAFAFAAEEALAAGPAALALLRVPAQQMPSALATLRDYVRRRDILGRHETGLLVLLLPHVPAAAALQRITELVAVIRDAGAGGMQAGVAASPGAGARTLEDMVAEADEALAEARYLGQLAAMKASHAGVEAAAREAPSPSAHTVLVADDDPDVVRIVEAQLRAAGYQPLLAFDGDQAYQTIRERHPDAVVLDLMMPRATGLEVLQAMREAPPPRPRMMVLSGRGREEDVTRAFDLGADDYLTKPFNPQELLARLARLLR